MASAPLHWYRTESHASPLGHEFRAEYRGRTWRMYRLADGSWKVVPTDRPQQARTFKKPEEARKYASQVAMTNPGRKRNPQEPHMATKKKNPTRPGHWKVQFTTKSGKVTDSPRFGSKAAAEAFRDEQLRTTGRYHEQESAQLYEYMDNGSYRARGKPKPSHASNPRDTEVDEHAANELELYIDNDRQLYDKWVAIVKNLWRHKAKGRYDSSRAADGFMYLVDDAAKKYAKEFDSPKNWNTIFTMPTRRAVAAEYAKSFENSSRDEIQYAPAGALQNPSKPRRKNPRRKKNGAGLGALIGSTIGSVAGLGVGSVPLAALGSLAGGTVGGYLGAPKDRKKRGAAGGAIGGALLGPVGAGIGGYVGGTKADKDYGGRRNNPGKRAREQNPKPEYTVRSGRQILGYMRADFRQASDSIWVKGPDLDDEWYVTSKQVADYRHRDLAAARDLFQDEVEDASTITIDGTEQNPPLRRSRGGDPRRMFYIVEHSDGRWTVHEDSPTSTALLVKTSYEAAEQALIDAEGGHVTIEIVGRNPAPCACSHRTAALSRRVSKI